MIPCQRKLPTYILREMVLPEDELKIFNKPIYVRLEDSNQQIKKMANQMETSHRSQHDKSEGASTRQQRTHMETLFT